MSTSYNELTGQKAFVNRDHNHTFYSFGGKTPIKSSSQTRHRASLVNQNFTNLLTQHMKDQDDYYATVGSESQRGADRVINPHDLV